MRLILVCILLCFGPAIGAQSDQAAVKQQITAAYSKMSAAFKRKDIDAFMAYATPGFTVRQGKSAQPIDRVTAAKMIRNQMDMGTDVSWQRRIDKLTVKGARAVAAVTGTTTLKGRTRSGRPYRMRVVIRAQDTWASTSSGWRLLATHVTKTVISKS